MSVLFFLLGTACASSSPEALEGLAADFWTWRASPQPFCGDDIPRIDDPVRGLDRE